MEGSRRELRSQSEKQGLGFSFVSYLAVHILVLPFLAFWFRASHSHLCAVLTILFLQQIDCWMMNVTVWRFHTSSARS